MTKMRNQNRAVHRQRMFWVDIPAAECSEGTHTSEKLAQNHEVIRNICDRADNQYQISAVLDIRLKPLSEGKAMIVEIKVMNSFFDIGLELLRSRVRSHRKSNRYLYLYKCFTATKAVWWRVKRSIKIKSADQTIWNQYL